MIYSQHSPSATKPTKVLVTGAKGFIGSYTVKELQADENVEVVGLNGRDDCNLIYWNQVESRLNKEMPDVVVHCAGERGFRESSQTANTFVNNVMMFMNVNDWCVKNNARLINLSSGCWSKVGSAYTSYYENSKRVITSVRGSNLTHIVPYGVFGLGEGEQRFVHSCFQAITDEEPIKVFVDGMMSWIYVKDLAKLIKYHALDSGSQHLIQAVYQVDTAFKLSVFADKICSVVGKNVPIWVSKYDKEPERHRYLGYANSKAPIQRIIEPALADYYKEWKEENNGK
jgi:nucleoside-diphosphate-sugar epimerase